MFKHHWLGWPNQIDEFIVTVRPDHAPILFEVILSSKLCPWEREDERPLQGLLTRNDLSSITYS